MVVSSWILGVGILCIIFSTSDGACLKGRYQYTFGTDCKLECHCIDDTEVCDEVTGTCQSGCAEGWTGPGCQYRNLAMNAATNAGIGLSNVRVTNGDRQECTSQYVQLNNPFVTVTLDQVYDISDMKLFFGPNANTSIVEVYVGENANRNTMSRCARIERDSATGTTRELHVQCTQRMPVRYVSVLLPGQVIMDICEIEVFGGRSLAYNRPTKQITTLGTDWISDNAVDGGTDRWAHTVDGGNNNIDTWWYVDLEGQRRITGLVIYNREDDFIIRMKNFKIYISDTNALDDRRLVYTDGNDPPLVVTMVNLRSQPVGRYVWLVLEGENRIINLPEAVVLGGCTGDRCGLQCRLGCHCRDTYRPVMRELNGTCTGTCDRGWTGPLGLCSSSVCPSGRFGYGCNFACNCEGACDPWTGVCRDGGQCTEMWSGSICQAKNSIYKSLITAEGNTTYTSAAATVDGDVTTCGAVLAGPRASWTSPFPAQRLVDQVLVYINDVNGILGVQVTTENDVDSYLCDVTDVLIEGSLLARCSNFNATNLRITTSSVMQICEVKVLECVDGTFGERCGNICNCGNRVACNKTTGVCPSSSCLPGYRGDRCDQECRLGYYGLDCNEVCGNCKQGETCDPITGTCASGCAAGWRGSTCKDECHNGTFGESCSINCGLCLGALPCNKIYGTCSTGCAPGYQGELCAAECQAGRYGINCNGTCGSCSQSSPCDKRTGDCTVGCAMGYQPPLCQQECEFGTYGTGCSSQCGLCRNNQTCNRVTGACEGGCEPGVYLSAYCNRACIEGLFGYNCGGTCLAGVCKDTDVCNKSTGGCLYGCREISKQPPYCLTDCYNGTYGQDCRYTCGACIDGEECNKETGECPNGCERGYEGTKCNTLSLGLSGNSSGLSDGAFIAIGVTFAVLGIAAFIIAILICRRRQNTDTLEDTKPKDKEQPKTYDNNIALESGIQLQPTTPAFLKNRNSSTGEYHPNPEARSQPRGSIAIPDLWEYMQEKKVGKADLYQQFKDLTSGLLHPHEAARKAQNVKKNRYKEVYAYDHTRVKLDVVPGESGNDYINASFISGYNRPHTYIAAQGPTEELINDFWRMVWQKKCRKIVMLTRLVEQGQVKSAQYWPDDGVKQFGAVQVLFVNTEPYANFDIRTFKISVGTERREIKHFNFIAWPDRDVPYHASSIVEFWSKVRHTDFKDNVPVLVHCSAGLGRTGTFLALDYLVDQANVEGFVNVFQCVQKLRHQRVNMVQTQSQYVFLHEALLEALMCPSHSIPCEKFSATYRKLQEFDNKSRKSNLEVEFEKINHVTRYVESQRADFYASTEYKTARSDANKEKNRYSTIIPADAFRTKLVTQVFDRNDYINAVYMPTYREDKQFLVTQNPLPDTHIDFWRMVYEHEVTTIVCLQQCQTRSEMYWPMDGETVTFVPFQIKHVKAVDNITYSERTLTILNAEEPHERSRTIKQFECRFWEENNPVPVDTATVLAFQDQVQKWHRQTGNTSIVVHCLNGATRSGLYCVLSAVIERLKQERDVAISQTLKQMRVRRQQIVPNVEQYTFCHDAVAEFLRGFDTYSNFFI